MGKRTHNIPLTPAPPKENDLQKYILNYLAENNDKYISWFLHYYERTLNEKAMAVVQDYAMYGHFLDIKQAYVIGEMFSNRINNRFRTCKTRSENFNSIFFKLFKVNISSHSHSS